MAPLCARVRSTRRQPHLDKGRNAHACGQLPAGVDRLREGSPTRPVHRSAQDLREGILQPQEQARRKGVPSEGPDHQWDPEEED